jgi:hypothetical protein
MYGVAGAQPGTLAVQASGRPKLDYEFRYAAKITPIAGYYGCSNFLGNCRDS